jgi:peptidylprolyl isomerase
VIYNHKYHKLVMLALLLLALLVAACGPAQNSVATEDGDSETATEGESAVGDEAATESEAPVNSGLIFEEIVAGTGAQAQPGDIVAVHYRGTLADGTEFDSSYGRGEPFTFQLGTGQVIPGWDEGIAMMKEGGQARLTIPPELAYGDRDLPGIPAGSTLFFDVELVSVTPGPTPTPAPEMAEVAEADFTVTDSGLKYAVLQPGDGAKPQLGEIVGVYFTAWLEDGTVFGDVRSGEPVQFIVGQEELLAGLDEAVLLMQQGEKAQFVIPSELGFGAEGAPGLIPPDATLIFEMELASISPAPPTPTPAPPPTSIDDADFTVTDSGLKFYDLVKGDGPTPQPGDTVQVHYRLWLEDGTQIDSSLDRGEPFTFVVGTNSTIPGWEEGVLLMNQGGKAQIIVPPSLAYGEQGSGPIPPGSNLIFELELLDIISAE